MTAITEITSSERAVELLSSPTDEHHLAALLLAPAGRTHLDAAFEAVRGDDFSDPFLGEVWESARALHTEGKRLSERLILLGLGADAEGLRGQAYRNVLRRVQGEPVVGYRIPESIRAVRDTARMRRLVEGAVRIVRATVESEDYSTAYERAQAILGDLEGGENPSELRSYDDLVEEWNRAQDGDRDTGVIIPTPWPDLDEVLAGGLHTGRVYVVAARPGEGKSLLGLNVAQHAATQGLSTLVVSAEMSDLEVMGRWMASGARVEYAEIVRYQLSDFAKDRIRRYQDETKGIPLHVLDKRGVTVEYIAAVARTAKRTHGLDVLFVDYLQLLNGSNPRLPRHEQIGQISQALKHLALELDIVVVAAAQLNRNSSQEGRPPRLDDLRESGKIEQDADVVLGLHHPKDEEGDPTGNVHVCLLKNRTGRAAGGVVELRWAAYQARIVNP